MEILKLKKPRIRILQFGKKSIGNGGALWISTKRNYKNEILELKSWGNVCQNLSEYIFENLNSNYSTDSLSYEYFKLEIMSYLTRYLDQNGGLLL